MSEVLPWIAVFGFGLGTGMVLGLYWKDPDPASDEERDYWGDKDGN